MKAPACASTPRGSRGEDIDNVEALLQEVPIQRSFLHIQGPLQVLLLIGGFVGLLGLAGVAVTSGIERETHAARTASGGPLAVQTLEADASSPKPACAPDDERVYIFGYGSLMMRASVVKTNCQLSDETPWSLQFLLDTFKDNKEVSKCIEKQMRVPFTLVEATGISRGWYAPGTLQTQALLNWSVERMEGQYLDLAPTYLGAIRKKRSKSTGVIFPVGQAGLESTDKRETGSTGVQYTKEWMQLEDLNVLGGPTANLTCAKIRWYAMPQVAAKTPTAQFPIVQSYVDLFVGGALDLERAYNVTGFALGSVVTTAEWSPFWVNDRMHPYRPFEMNKMAGDITSIILNATQVKGSPLTMDQVSQIKLR